MAPIDPVVAVRETVVRPSSNGRPTWALAYRVGTRGRASTPTEIVKQIVETEGPIHLEVLSRRTTLAMGWQRTGANIQAAIDRAIAALVKSKAIIQNEDFLWPSTPGFELRVRYPSGPDSERRIHQIAPEELQLALCQLVIEAMSLTEEELLTQAARLLGFDRRGHLVDDGLRTALSTAIAGGFLRRVGDRIST